MLAPGRVMRRAVLLVDVEQVLLAVIFLLAQLQPRHLRVLARVHRGGHVAEFVLVREVAARRVHIRNQILSLFLDLELVVGDYDECLDQLGELVVTEAHVLDGQTLAQFQDQLAVPVDEVAIPIVALHWKHFGLDVDFN